jgi:hypothetical protein
MKKFIKDPELAKMFGVELPEQKQQTKLKSKYSK